jgi:hypothetical protein
MVLWSLVKTVMEELAVSTADTDQPHMCADQAEENATGKKHALAIVQLVPTIAITPVPGFADQREAIVMKKSDAQEKVPDAQQINSFVLAHDAGIDAMKMTMQKYVLVAVQNVLLLIVCVEGVVWQEQ